MFSLGQAVRQWVRQYGKDKTVERVKEGIKEKKINTKNLVLGSLAQGMMGDRWTKSLSRPSRALEAAEAVDVSAFTDITGQILVTEVQEAYNSPEFIGDKLMRVIDEGAPFNLGEQIVPMVSNVLDGPTQLNAGQSYPSTQMIEDWVSYPAVGKYGEILQIFLETVLADRTGQIPDSAAKLGRRARLDREERQLKVVLGLVNNFKWKGTSYNTYLTSGNWINKVTGQTTSGGDYTIINTVEQLFAQMTDPYSGKPIDIQPSSLLCMPEARYDFKRIMQATTVRVGNTATSGGIQGESPNPLDQEYPIYSSKIARALLVASGVSAANVRNYWYLSDSMKAFIYRQILPWEVIEAPPTNELDFNNDVVMRIKVREMGVAGVANPRYSAQSIGS